MSRAFVKEMEDPGPEQPHEHPISPHPNLVTKRGLGLIDAELARLEAELAEAPDEIHEARLRRDQRYWTSRRATAQVTAPPSEGGEIGFGSRVTVRRDGKPSETIEIVGEDEADPHEGRISYVSPFAAALMGAEAGETVEVGPREPPIEVEIVKVENG